MLNITTENARQIFDWIEHRGGVAVWPSIDLSNPGRQLLTPAQTDGKPTAKPHWSVSDTPAIVTDPAMVHVSVARLVKRFHVAVRMSGNGLSLKCTDASSAKIRRECEKAGPGSWHVFDYISQEAAIYAPESEILLSEYAKNHIFFVEGVNHVV